MHLSKKRCLNKGFLDEKYSAMGMNHPGTCKSRIEVEGTSKGKHEEK